MKGRKEEDKSEAEDSQMTFQTNPKTTKSQ
jgi:hypothetical protein